MSKKLVAKTTNSCIIWSTRTYNKAWFQSMAWELERPKPIKCKLGSAAAAAAEESEPCSFGPTSWKTIGELVPETDTESMEDLDFMSTIFSVDDHPKLPKLFSAEEAGDVPASYRFDLDESHQFPVVWNSSAMTLTRKLSFNSYWSHLYMCVCVYLASFLYSLISDLLEL